ncbi:MAG: hypothetical protein HQL32_02535 [Planctomycetes bacterium]|nr:hypothetical protein [Planctomycetota bacterium]
MSFGRNFDLFSLMVSTKFSLIITFALFCLCITQARAGILDDFETSATQDQKKNNEKKESSQGSSFFSSLLSTFLSSDNETSTLSTTSKTPDSSSDNPSESIFPEGYLPYIRLGFNKQREVNDLDANDFFAQLGYKSLAFKYRYTYYWEKEPADKLRVTNMYALYRFNITEFSAFSAGCGVYTLIGNQQTSGFSLCASAIIHPKKYVGGEFNYAWASLNGNNINDYDGALLIGIPKACLKLGYRNIHTTHQSLQGPYAGISLKW